MSAINLLRIFRLVTHPPEPLHSILVHRGSYESACNGAFSIIALYEESGKSNHSKIFCTVHRPVRIYNNRHNYKTRSVYKILTIRIPRLRPSSPSSSVIRKDIIAVDTIPNSLVCRTDFVAWKGG